MAKNLRPRVQACLFRLEGAKAIRLSEGAFQGLQLHAGMREYVWLLDACRLLARWVLPGNDGTLSFKAVERDEKEMNRLFEAFIQGFFRLAQQSFQLASRSIEWPWQAADEVSQRLQPCMQTDVTLRRGQEVIVIDAKYYARTLAPASAFSKESVHSGNLYQMHAYLSGYAKLGARPLKGILLYPKVDRDINVSYRHDDYVLNAVTLDLNKDWPSIERNLLSLVGL